MRGGEARALKVGKDMSAFSKLCVWDCSWAPRSDTDNTVLLSPSIGEGVTKLWSIRKMEYYSAMKRNQ